MGIKEKIKAFLKSYLKDSSPDYLGTSIDRGMQVGENCNIQPQVYFDYHHAQLIHIGNNVTIAPQAFILAHDASTKQLIGYTRIGKIVIKDNVFIGARAMIMPGVTIGENSIIGAMSVVTKDIPPDSIAVGNPAKVVQNIKEYTHEKEQESATLPKFGEEYTFRHDIPYEERQILNQKMNNLMDPFGFII